MSLSKPSNNEALRTFSGEPKDYPQWRLDFFDHVRNMTSIYRFGMTFYVMALAEYNLQFNPGEQIVAHVELADPGNEPAIFADGANQAVVARWTAEHAIWLRGKVKFEELKSLKLELKNLVIRVTPLEAAIQIRDPIVGWLMTSPDLWLVNMDRNFGRLSAKDLQTVLAQLDSQYDQSSSFATHVAMHSLAHLVQEANGQPLRELDKVRLLIDSLTDVGFFRDKIQSWRLTRANVADQLFLGADGISTALIDFERNYDRSTSSKAAGFSAAVVPSNQPTIQAQVSALVQAHLAAAASPQPIIKQGGKNKQRGAGAGGGGFQISASTPFYYCWSHGLCTHKGYGPAPPLGIGCAHKKPGHDDNATWRNRNGGSSNS